MHQTYDKISFYSATILPYSYPNPYPILSLSYFVHQANSKRLVF